MLPANLSLFINAITANLYLFIIQSSILVKLSDLLLVFLLHVGMHTLFIVSNKLYGTNNNKLGLITFFFLQKRMSVILMN
jgi:hypothetical protein